MYFQFHVCIYSLTDRTTNRSYQFYDLIFLAHLNSLIFISIKKQSIESADVSNRYFKISDEKGTLRNNPLAYLLGLVLMFFGILIVFVELWNLLTFQWNIQHFLWIIPFKKRDSRFVFIYEIHLYGRKLKYIRCLWLVENRIGNRSKTLELQVGPVTKFRD